MATTSIWSTTRFTAIASGDVLPCVDVSDTTQSAHGSLLSMTVTNFFATIPVPVVVTSASANALAVGRLGSTTPAFTVDASTGSQVAGLKVTGAVTGGSVAVVVTDSGADASLTVNAKGAGTIGIGSVSTGRVTITPVCTITGALTLSAALTYGGVALSNAVTGTGNMVLSASPTLTGTALCSALTASGAVACQAGATVQAGSSTSYYKPALVLYENQSLSTASTSEASLASVSIAANTLSANGQVLRVTIRGSWDNASGVGPAAAVQVIKFGATSVTFGLESSTNSGSYSLVVDIARTGAATQEMRGWRLTDSQSFAANTINPNQVKTASPTETLSGAVTLDFRGRVSTAATTNGTYMKMDIVTVEHLAS